MKKGPVIFLVVVVAFTATWVIFRNVKESIAPGLSYPSPAVSGFLASQPSTTPTPTISLLLSTPTSQSNTIIYTDSGYSPATLTVKKGQTVIWKNESSFQMWTASAIHPTHKVYPGTDIALCGTQMLIPMFDACAGTSSGQSWSFTFVNTGTWKYHNHLNSSQFGTVVVE